MINCKQLISLTTHDEHMKFLAKSSGLQSYSHVLKVGSWHLLAGDVSRRMKLFGNVMDKELDSFILSNGVVAELSSINHLASDGGGAVIILVSVLVQRKLGKRSNKPD